MTERIGAFVSAILLMPFLFTVWIFVGTVFLVCPFIAIICPKMFKRGIKNEDRTEHL